MKGLLPIVCLIGCIIAGYFIVKHVKCLERIAKACEMLCCIDYMERTNHFRSVISDEENT